MREPMSGEFVMSFVQTCMEAGLSKEATAELLQRQSVVHAGEQSPDWLEGYEKIASMVPGELLPLFRDGYIEKSARPNGKLAWQAIKDLGSAMRGNAGSSAHSVAGVTKKLNTSPKYSKSFKNYPLPIAVGGAAAGYGISRLVGGSGSPGYETPYMPPGGYTPEGSAAAFDAAVADDGVGIAEHNKKFFGIDERRRKLQAAVDENTAGSGKALIELNALNAEHANTTKQRQKYMENINRNATASSEKLNEIKERQAAIESHKTSLWRMPQRAYYRVTGRDPNAVYNGQIESAQNEAARAAQANRQAEISRARMEAGYTGGVRKSRTPSQMQNDFYPSYNP